MEITLIYIVNRKNKSFGGKQMEITEVIKQYHLDILRCATLAYKISQLPERKETYED
jgi:hypothetical protein